MCFKKLVRKKLEKVTFQLYRIYGKVLVKNLSGLPGNSVSMYRFNDVELEANGIAKLSSVHAQSIERFLKFSFEKYVKKNSRGVSSVIESASRTLSQS